MVHIPRKRLLLLSIFLLLLPYIAYIAFDYIVSLTAWPYWPYVVPNVGTIHNAAGDIGVFVRALYLTRGLYAILGVLSLIYWGYSVNHN